MSRNAALLVFMLQLTACSSSTQYMIARVHVLEAERQRQDAIIDALKTRETILTAEQATAGFDVRNLNNDNARQLQEITELRSIVRELKTIIDEKNKTIMELNATKEEQAYVCGRLTRKINGEFYEPCVNYHREFLRQQQKRNAGKEYSPKPQVHPREAAPGLG